MLGNVCGNVACAKSYFFFPRITVEMRGKLDDHLSKWKLVSRGKVLCVAGRVAVTSIFHTAAVHFCKSKISIFLWKPLKCSQDVGNKFWFYLDLILNLIFSAYNCIKPIFLKMHLLHMFKTNPLKYLIYFFILLFYNV